MPLDKKDLPLEVEDHVILDDDLLVGHTHGYGEGLPHIVVPAGTHGMVKRLPKVGLQAEFGGQLFHVSLAWAANNLTLYRRSQHSKRRT